MVVPERYVVIVTLIDDSDDEPRLVSRSFSGDARNVTFTLKSKRLWQYNFLAYGCEEHAIARLMISMALIIVQCMHPE